MANIMNSVENYLVSQGYKYAKLDNNQGFSMSLKGENIASIKLLINVQEKGFVCYALAPINAPEKMRSAISEFMTYANYGMRHCTFEIDMSDGEIRARTSLYAADQVPPIKAVEFIVDSVTILMDKYMPGVNAVLYGGVSPKDAVGQIEN